MIHLIAYPATAFVFWNTDCRAAILVSRAGFVLWSVHQVSPLERQEQFYFSLHYTDALEEDHKHSSIIKDVLLN